MFIIKLVNLKYLGDKQRMIEKIINRCLIFFDAIVTFFINKFKKKNNGSKNVLIVFQQAFGDTVAISNCLDTYCKLYSKEDGYNLKFLAKPANIDFMKETLPIPKELIIESVDFKKFIENYSYYKEIKKKYSNADMLIVPGTSLSAEIFSTISRANRKIGLLRCMNVEKPIPMAIFYKIAYTEKVIPPTDMMILQRHRLLLNYLGANDFKAQLPKMLELEKLDFLNNKYCVIGIGASITEKYWPIERYLTLIDYIIENKKIEVHLCGGKSEEELENYILNNTKYPNKVKSHIGKTTFKEWVSIIEHAEFVLGNDSATVHIAVASRVKTICITGVYDKFQFFPYKVDELKGDEILPVVIMNDMPCAWCRTKGYYSGYKNKDCKKRIKEGKCTLCIDKISVETVKESIYEII